MNDDPVDGTDPLGLGLGWGTITGAWNDTGGKAVSAVNMAATDTGHFLSDPNRWRNEANYLAGVGNGIVSTVTFGQVHISEPYCGELGWIYGLGTGIGIVGTVVGGGVAVNAIRGATAADEGGSLAEGWRGTNMSDEESFNYHYGAHGAGEAPEQYAQDARNWAANPAGIDKPVQLADGSTGTVYRTPGGGPGGIL
ncbi:MAG: hypothetical protein JWM55_1145, partial [Acidimicrobiaceae bacterium]|nr:hypothetical protein [Acidimicrobiaceae bacterium]